MTTAPLTPDPDAPLYERELTIGTTTLRVTVDGVDGERWACLTTEHVRPDGPQQWAQPSLPDLYVLRQMMDDAITVMEADDAGRQAA